MLDSPPSIEDLLRCGRAAQLVAADWTQEQVDEVVGAAAWSVFDDARARYLAQLAHDTTSLGNAEDTYARHRRRVLGTLRDLHGAASVGVVAENRIDGITKIAKPLGLIAAMTPATAPTAAVAQNSLMALKTRNAIVFCPHPLAVRAAFAVTEALREALRKVGAPADLIQCVHNPKPEIARELMAQADLILAAGGEGTVRRAYSSGRPAYGGGTGNAVVILDETAEVQSACGSIFHGKHFDHGTACSSESCLLVAESIWDSVLKTLMNLGAHLCDAQEAARLRALMWPDGLTLSRSVVGRSAQRIAELAQIRVRPDTRVLLVTPEHAPGVDLFSQEKLSPVLAAWKFQQFEEAVCQVGQLTQRHGRGHSCGIFSARRDHIDRLAHAVSLSRVMVNQSTGVGNSGDFANGMPFSPILCCGTWGGSHVSENITWRHLLNYTWVSEPIAKREPDPQRLFAQHWEKYGRD